MSEVTDLCVPTAHLRLPKINKADLAVIAMPVFAGRVPALAVERLRKVDAQGAKCVVVAVFGNRAYDDALLELRDVALEMGFRVIAAVEAAKRAGAVISYDPNYRAALWPDEAAAAAQMRSMVPYADVMKLSDEETLLLTGAAEPEEAAHRLLAQGVSCVAVTLGERGALILYGYCGIASRQSATGLYR